jgi:hypothetical protein
LAAHAGIINGDFEAGNTGFTSAYTYVNPGTDSLYPESVYTIDTNAQASHPAFSNLGDHTSGSGKYMIVNGSGAADKTVWEGTTDFELIIGQTYSFSAWVANVHDANPAQLQFKVDGVALNATPLSPTGVGQWQQISATFVATSTTSLFTLSNSQLALNGNDFAVDDIMVAPPAPVPEPATMAVLAAGALGLIRRRRRA